jgi:fatty acid desaturase
VPSSNGWEQDSERQKKKKEVGMLEAILIILVVLWALGLFAFHAGGLIHVLLVIALVVLIVRLLQGRKIL